MEMEWRRIRKAGVILVVFVAVMAGAVAQSAAPAGPSRAVAVQAQAEQIEDLRSRVEGKRAEVETTASDELRSTLVAELRDLERQLDNARFELLNVLTDSDLSDFRTVEETPFTLQGSVEDLVKPLIQEVKNATESSRERRELEDRYEEAQRREGMFRNAVESIDGALGDATDPVVRQELENLRGEYVAKLASESNALRVLAYRIGQLDEGKSIVSETGGILSSFFRERGRNLLLAILAAGVVAVGLRILHGYLHDHGTVFRKGRSTAARLLDVALYVFTFLGALIAAVVVLMVAGDWVLMGVVVLILLALILTAKDSLPGYADEIRMMLNMGPVREGERIVFNGVPWTVENLSFFTILRNPVLRGGMVRMPIAQLQGMLSRPVGEDEPYFPSHEGDWVLLDDRAYGEVVFQSVEMVRVRLLGGALKMYPTEEYLGQNPVNNSRGFRITTTIGIDYEYQSRVTTEILDGLRTFFREEVEKLVPIEHIVALKVEFELANASSLDYAVLLDLKGEMAPRFNPLGRALQRIGVDACNKYDLVIPFQQITLHRAGA